MTTSSAFWDSSAIVPLCVHQKSSPGFHKLWRQTSRIAVWAGATVEIRSALARLNRDGELDAKGLGTAIKRLDASQLIWREIVWGEKLRLIAEDLPDTYGLGALDSFQLAAALVWCKERPRGRLFVCDDVRLVNAAQKVGFKIKP